MKTIAHFLAGFDFFFGENLWTRSGTFGRCDSCGDMPGRNFEQCHHIHVNAITKLKNLKAIHNGSTCVQVYYSVVTAITKLKNLKAIHNSFLLANDISSKLLYIPNSYRS